MKTSHTLQVTAHPYSLGSPRLYFAKDYGVGDTVVNSDVVWVVKEFSGVLLFVAYEENEEEMIRMAKSGSTTTNVNTINWRTIMTHNREDVTDYGVLFIIGFIALCVLL